MSLHDRISAHAPGYGQGRKWAERWQTRARHCARVVNTPHVVVRTCDVPPEFRARLGWRIDNDMENY